MAGIGRHMYPGNNTPEGFFSYYQYILGQKEAGKIICIKGGPAAGKSTFLKKIGESMLQEGHDIDFLHCAYDTALIDGIIMRNKKIALISGTSLSVSEPVSPGSVDSVIHLEDYWDDEGIVKNQETLNGANDNIRAITGRAYNYLSAAGKMYDNLSSIYDSALNYEELYRISAKVIGDELAHREIRPKQGDIRKYFASAITPEGFEHYITTLANECNKVYLIHAPVGVSSEKMLNVFMEGAVYRGFEAEGYYCSMKPSTKLEHLLIPELSLAFITSNKYHSIQQSQLSSDSIPIDLESIIRFKMIKSQENILADSEKKMDELLENGIYCLNLAKHERHDLEKFYIPNLDFLKFDMLRKEITRKFSQR
jgi:hypothetical protein